MYSGFSDTLTFDVSGKWNTHVKIKISLQGYAQVFHNENEN